MFNPFVLNYQHSSLFVFMTKLQKEYIPLELRVATIAIRIVFRIGGKIVIYFSRSNCSFTGEQENGIFVIRKIGYFQNWRTEHYYFELLFQNFDLFSKVAEVSGVAHKILKTFFYSNLHKNFEFWKKYILIWKKNRIFSPRYPWGTHGFLKYFSQFCPAV